MADAEPLRAALAAVIDPEIRRPITELDMVARADLDAAGRASVALQLTIVGCPAARRIEQDVRDAVLAAPGVTSLELEIGVMTSAQRQALVERLRGAKRANPFGPGTLTRVLAITSGKGGVGKSTVTANLAIELARRGLSVGVVDADVHGFSIPRILGLVDADGQAVRPTRVGEMILPPVAEVGLVAGSGTPAVVKAISIGMFVEPGAAVAWRGPMLHRTLEQFLTDVWFGDLDVLLLDLPPGTGDIAISAGQLLPNADVIVVTTPQPAAADVAVRSGAVARQTGQRVVGVIETMSRNGALDVFGEGGGAEVARHLSADGDESADAVPLLGTIPLSPELRTAGDAGRPLPADSPDAAAAVFRALAERLTASRPSLAGRPLPLSPR